MRLILKHQSWFINILASVFIFLFAYTALSKLMSMEIFKIVLSKSEILQPVADFISWGIPVSELVICLLLFFNSSRKFGLLLSTVLMGLFTIYIALMLLFVPDLPCSCGGVIQQMSWPQHFVFNITFFILGFLGWRMSGKMTQDFIAINRQSRTPV
jgi:hypothetical protein